MAETLRRTLDLMPVVILVISLALIYLPLAGGLWPVLAPALSLAVWQTLWADAQWLGALRLTVMSASISTLLALAIALAITIRLYPGVRWQRLRLQLPLWLAMPHAAFAIGLFFLLSPSGWLARLAANLFGLENPPDWLLVQDTHALALSVALALKEAVFLLWMLAALLDENTLRQQLAIARSLGYPPAQAWRRVILPQVLPRLGWPLLAVWAYSLSVVDMALILGPNTPPTLAVLAWQWLGDADTDYQQLGKASAASLLLLLLAGAALVQLGWWLYNRHHRLPDGVRATSQPRLPLPDGSRFMAMLHYVLLALLLLWSVADGWFFPSLWPDQLTLSFWQDVDWSPFANSSLLALASAASALAISLLWLEWGDRRLDALLYLPLILPALPLAAAQYAALLSVGLDGSLWAVWWSHLLWVLPYTLLTLAGPYRASDRRLMATARALGYSRLAACFRVKWPLLLRPTLAALSVGFAVSIAQYLPTLFAGAGRISTVTTEAVALASGGNRRLQATQALLQILLPLLAFLSASLLAQLAGRYRKGLR